MNIDPIPPLTALDPTTSPANAAVPAAQGFEAMALSGLEKVDQAIKTSDASLQSYAAGGDVPVHQVMIDMEKARMALQTAIGVRDHIVDAYQEFMRMQL